MLVVLLVWFFMVGVVFGGDGSHFGLFLFSDELLVFGGEVEQFDVVVFGQVEFPVAFG
jgi:hypothetical protein